jgi:hypothetical protein
MKITRDHLAYWTAKHAPAWAQAIAKPAPAPSVHTLINAQALPGDRNATRDVSNMLAVLRLARENEARGNAGGFLACLRSYAGRAYGTSTLRQSATARKWLARLEAKQ